jgi:hypothetical protein
MVKGVGHLAVPQLVSESCRASIEWSVRWFGCAGRDVYCPSVVRCGSDLDVGSLSILYDGRCDASLVASRLCPSNLSFASEVEGMELTWSGVGGWGRRVGVVAVSRCGVLLWSHVADLM